jgi:hypothetical protein
MLAIIDSRRCRLATIEKRHPGARIIDVTSKAVRKKSWLSESSRSRLLLTDDQRRLLAVKGKSLG